MLNTPNTNKFNKNEQLFGHRLKLKLVTLGHVTTDSATP